MNYKLESVHFYTGNFTLQRLWREERKFQEADWSFHLNFLQPCKRQHFNVEMQNNSTWWTCPIFSSLTEKSGLFPGVQRVWGMLWPLVSCGAESTGGLNSSPSLLALPGRCEPLWAPFERFLTFLTTLSPSPSLVLLATSIYFMRLFFPNQKSNTVWVKPGCSRWCFMACLEETLDWGGSVLGLPSKLVNQTGNVPLAVWVSPSI